MLSEPLSVTPGFQVGAEGCVGCNTLAVQIAQRFAVEAQDVAQHPPERRRTEVAALSKQAVEGITVVLNARNRVAHRKAHLRGLEGHAQRGQQANEVRVGPVVEHDEAGINGVLLAVDGHVHGMGMTANPVSGFKHADLVVAIEQIRGSQPRDATANDRDFHGVFLSAFDERTMHLPSASCRRVGSSANRRRVKMNAAGKAISKGRRGR